MVKFKLNKDNLNMRLSEEDLSNLRLDPHAEPSVLYYFTEPNWKKYSGYAASSDLPEVEDYLENYSFSEKKFIPSKRDFPLVNLVKDYVFLTKELN